VPEEPWATVCSDFVGALPRSKHGNQMLVMIDRFSKWTELMLQCDSRVAQEGV